MTDAARIPQTTPSARSLWLDPARERRAGPAPVPLPSGAEVVVVGAGVVGSTVADLLARAGADVVLLDADLSLGRAASAHATVKVTVAQGRWSSVVEARGRDRAGRDLLEHVQGLTYVRHFVEEAGLDHQLVTHSVYATTESERPRVAEEADLLRAAGLAVGLPDGPALGTGPVLGGYGLGDQVLVDPVDYVLARQRSAAAHGAQLVDGAMVERVRTSGGAHVLSTSAGEVRAERVVLASHVPFVERALTSFRQEVQRVHAVAGVLPPGCDAGATYALGTATRSTRTVRHLGRDLLVVVGESHPTGVDHGVRPWEALRSWAAERYGVREWTHAWATQDPHPFDSAPLVGEVASGIVTATGFGGWGFTGGTAAATALAAALQGKQPEALQLWGPRRVGGLAGALDQARTAVTLGRRAVGGLASSDAPEESAVAPGSGAVVGRGPGQRAVSRDDDGVLHVVSARCTHLGCTVAWNTAERTWDCPCHGSRFAPDGSVLEGPATRPLAAVPLSAVTES